jgi:hypothetical protein
VYKNKGLLFPAWRDTGKTTLILNILSSQKVEFLSDDLTILKNDGTIYCLPDYIRVRYPQSLKNKHISRTRLLFSNYSRRRLQSAVLPRLGRVLKGISKPLGTLLIGFGNRPADILLHVNELFPDIKILRIIEHSTIDDENQRQ